MYLATIKNKCKNINTTNKDNTDDKTIVDKKDTIKESEPGNQLYVITYLFFTY
jgi:hypothetical protein